MLVEELHQDEVPVVIAAVVGDVFSDEFLRLDDLVVEEIRRLLQHPLTVVERVIVPVLPLRASLTQTDFDSPIDRFAA